MNGRRAVVGLCMLCALLVSAFAAQSASAISGTTAFTCKNVGSGGGFSEDHCKTAEANGAYKHEAIAEKTSTELTGNSNGEVSKLKSTIGGLGVTLTSTSLEGTGTMENKVAENGEHFGHGEGTIVYKGVTVNVPNCFVYTDVLPGKTVGTQGVVDTEPLTATTQGQGDSLKFTPKAGGVFARFWILGEGGVAGKCNIAGTYVVSGSVTGKPSGATTVTTHAEVTTANTLKMGPTEEGAKAGIEGSLALEARTGGAGAYTPISATTVST